MSKRTAPLGPVTTGTPGELPKTLILDGQKIYSVAAVAELMAVKPSTVHRWIRKGRLHARKHGRTSWITERDIAAMLT